MDKALDTAKIQEYLKQHKVEPSEQELNDLSQGKSVLFKNVAFDNGSSMDSNVKLFEDKNGELKASWNFPSKSLDIPERMFNQKLTPQQQQDLKELQTVTMFVKGDKVSLFIDEHSNKLTVNVENAKLNPFKLGLNEEEAKLLLEGKPVPTRLYYDKKTNQYIKSDLSYDPKTGKLNFANLSLVPNAEVDEQHLKLKENKTKEVNVDQVLGKVDGYLKTKDFDGLQAYSENNPEAQKIDNEKIKDLPSYQSLNQNEKLASLVAIGKQNAAKEFNIIEGVEQSRSQGKARGMGMGLPKEKKQGVGM